jgi:O-antigen/teichoic acid export membrane protein
LINDVKFNLNLSINRDNLIYINKEKLKNVLWNFTGGIISGISLIIVTPLYIKLLGVDGYGILSLWMVFQLMLGLFDFGLGPTIIKEFSNKLREKQSSINLLRTAECLNLVISLIILSSFFFLSDWLGKYWFKSSYFTSRELSLVIKLISVAIAFQFPSGLYLNVLTGMQDHRKMNIIQIISNLTRVAFGLGALLIYPDLNYFFTVQIVIALFQTVFLRIYIWRSLKDNSLSKPKIDFNILIPIWRFSVGMALTTFAAVALSNVDKIILSKIVTTKELGIYSIAFSATGILQLAIQPFYKTYFPRFSQLITENNTIETYNEYFKSCQLMASILLTIGTMGFVFAPYLFKVWLGSYDSSIINIFRVLLLGITCSGLMWLPSAFQQAHNWTSLHFKMILFALVIVIPGVIIATIRFGAIGGAFIWLVHGFSELTIGLWIMHKRILIGEFITWYKKVIFIPLIIAIPVSILSNIFIANGINIWLVFFQIIITGVIILSCIFLIYNLNNKFNYRFLKD